ncbi:MAG: amino acid racemase [Actinomycetia bacterium]|nr:amino acid racemase [Actinomycetes bacterium]MCP3910975.1 amino acid racemase [Actinomycetes bacterium]MCP4086437.1 amino acid racemase [Actinomycetes bacterium]
MPSPSSEDKTVGIMGGMGPEATIDLMRRVVEATPAGDDIDHVRMLVDNNPKVPSRIEALIEGTGETPVPHLVDMARGLEQQGADFLVIACNTAHHYHSEVAAAVGVPVLNMVALAARHIVEAHPDTGRVGLLASTALQLVHLYEPAFAGHGIEVVYPTPELQDQVMDLIRAVKAGQATDAQIRRYREAAADLVANGAQCLLIACTELSVVTSGLEVAAPVHDASEILAQAVVRMAREP